MPTAPTRRSIPRMVASILPLFLFGVCGFEIVGGISVGFVFCGAAGTSVISGNVGSGVIGSDIY